MLRSNHIFAALMALSFLSAFILPVRWTTPGVGELQGLFSPVSRPARAISGFAYRHFHREPLTDDQSPIAPRPTTTVYEENHELLSAYASLLVKFDQLSQLNFDREALGDIRSLCKPATVTGSEVSGLREALTVSVGGSSALIANRPVIRGNPSQSPMPCDLIGRIVRSGPAGAQVRLVTDPGFVLTARIGRYEADADNHLKLNFVEKIHPLIRGIGHNEMAVSSNLSLEQVQQAHIEVNDLILLYDSDWPLNIQGFSVGRIVSIGRQAKAPLLADIRIEPQTNLMRLTEVMVMVKD